MRYALQRAMMIAAIATACVTFSQQRSTAADSPTDSGRAYSLSEFDALMSFEEVYNLVVDALLGLFESSDSPAQKVAPAAQKVAPALQKVAPRFQKVAPRIQKVAPALQKVQPVLQKVAPRIQKVRVAH